jgi:rhodanese-related sulfurtransferase
LPVIGAAELKRALESGSCSAFDLGPSMAFRKAHIPGSRWSIRSRLVNDARRAKGTIVLVCDNADVARLAGIDLAEAGLAIARLDGGLDAWQRAGFPTEASPDTPSDGECIDYLFFVHDRHSGNREAMKQYLAWETGLLAQLDDQDRSMFRIGAAPALR